MPETPGRPAPGSRLPRRLRGLLLALVAVGAGATVAQAAVNAPHLVATGSTDELVILEGYAPGSIVTVDVLRGTLRTATTGPLTVPASGIIEINHPVDAGQTPTCWRSYTPDIVYGDVIRVTTQGAPPPAEESVVRNLTVTAPQADPLNLSTGVIVEGTAVSENGTGRLDEAGLEVRLINPAFQGVFGGRPFVLAPGLGTIGFDSPAPSTDPAWTATFSALSPAAFNAAINADAEASWANAGLTEVTEVGVAPAPLEPGLVGCTPPLPDGGYAATKTTPNVIPSTATGFDVQGAARAAATDVDLEINDNDPGTATAPTIIPNVPLSAPTPLTNGGRTWATSVAPADLTGFSGILTVTPIVDTAAENNIRGAARTVVIGLPATTITSPAAGATSPTADTTFTFTSNGNDDITFECGRDLQPLSPCSSPHTVTGVPNGAHSFQVRARDGNSIGQTTTHNWNVAKPLPVAQIVAGPAAVTNATSASFGVSVDIAVNGFECSVDNAAFTACGDPPSIAGLGEGPHSMRVRGIDVIPGNGPGAPSAAYNWTVDLTAPDTSITNGPDNPTTEPGAVFAFASPEAGATFECRLDNGAFAACASPFTISRVDPGVHTFSVRARDAAGNVDGTPAASTWRALEDTDPPNLRVTIVNARNPVLAKTGLLRINVRCGERCRAVGRLRVTVPALRRGGKARVFKFDSVPVNIAAGRTAQIRLRINGLQRAALRRALRSGRNVRANVTVVATDRSGNQAVAPLGVTLTRRSL